MKIPHYSNELYIIIALILGAITVYKLPQRFTKQATYLFLVCGMFFGFFFDHTLSALPVSYYQINDSSNFELMDFLSHVMYGPYGYLFFYLYDYFKIKPQLSLIYILVWALISTGIEQISEYLGVFHYENGYTIYYSFSIYLLVHSSWVIFYGMIKKYGEKQY